MMEPRDLTKEAKVEILHYDAAPLFASFEAVRILAMLRALFE